MGISLRLKKLMSSPTITKEQLEDLMSAYDMLCDPEAMGGRFKFFTIHEKTKQDLPAGFTEF